MKFKVKERVVVTNLFNKPVCEGEIVNINDFREPALRYAVQVDGYDDVIFVGKSDLQKLEENSMNELVKSVEKWSEEKGLDQADSSKQMLKVVEEIGEVAAALARGKEDDFRDGVGDVVVTLIILAQQNGMTLEECLNVAWLEIADRKGKMINGVFVKNSDLEGINK